MWARYEKVNYILLMSLRSNIYYSFSCFKHYQPVRFELDCLSINYDLPGCVLVNYVHKSDPSTGVILIETTIHVL